MYVNFMQLYTNVNWAIDSFRDHAALFVCLSVCIYIKQLPIGISLSIPSGYVYTGTITIYYPMLWKPHNYRQPINTAISLINNLRNNLINNYHTQSTELMISHKYLQQNVREFTQRIFIMRYVYQVANGYTVNITNHGGD